MGLLWDQEMPLIIKKPFNEWCHELKDLHLVSNPRFYDFTDSNATDIQLHGFSDSPIKAYGTIIYIRVIRTDGSITTSFVTSKSRVAPLKTLSLPRLEWMGALLSTGLCSKVSKTLKLEKSCFFHTDSSMVYHWIQGEPFRFKPFVKNRIEEIQKLTEPSKWHHCPGKENPADIISRGISVRQFYFLTWDYTWKFIVERAPWWGGFYERLVKSVKDSLRKILGKALLTFEELTTFLVETEYIVNSRPLTYVTDDFSEPNPLTPIDFLEYGRKNHDYPLHFAELANKVFNGESLIKRKQYQTTLLKHFWNKWKTQYLLDLKTVHIILNHRTFTKMLKLVMLSSSKGLLSPNFSGTWEQFKKLLWVEMDT
ncbi:integrase catalytic domain-containing protein [Trichonephila inaurata madagascariensis]|uniref:Integrase catalytic domain-containing protein n=1 Tax=Trichonephila inaurata madagascariensis TaxID=2747483 RepID=A0A8X6WNP1_9ARAC|nr:integrase catalytic domain-containing protein [Trichonephila inaurata madagascariensis]